MTKPIVAVDIDDVLALSAQAFVKHSNEKWLTNLTVDDYSEDWGAVWGLDKHDATGLAEIQRRAQEYFDATFKHMPHDVYAHDVLKSLKDDYELVIVTSRRLSEKDRTKMWLAECFPGTFHEDDIHFAGIWDTEDKATALHRTKSDLLIDLGADILIDDQPKHCNSAAENGIGALLFGGYAWQEGPEIHENVVKVKDWQGVWEFLNENKSKLVKSRNE